MLYQREAGACLAQRTWRAGDHITLHNENGFLRLGPMAGGPGRVQLVVSQVARTRPRRRSSGTPPAMGGGRCGLDVSNGPGRIRGPGAGRAPGRNRCPSLLSSLSREDPLACGSGGALVSRCPAKRRMARTTDWPRQARQGGPRSPKGGGWECRGSRKTWSAWASGRDSCTEGVGGRGPLLWRAGSGVG